MPPLIATTIHDGVVVLPLYGVILLSRHVHRHSDSTKPSVVTDFVTSFHNSSTSQGITLPEPERACPPDLRLQGGNVAPCATRRPSPSATAGPRLQSPAWNHDAS